MAALPDIISQDVADYHVSRQRCTRAAKRAKKRKAKAEGEAATAEVDETAPAEKEVIYRPEVLDHLVLGLNETTKALERSIAELRLRMQILADALQASSTTPRFLPTARSAAPAAAESPIVFVVVPHESVSPFTLIKDLATTVATHNTLLRQYSQLQKGTHAPQYQHLAHLAGDIPEIRLVPLGNRGQELAGAAGLRRLASFAVRRSHPSLPVLERLLPKSLLHPPRHSITLPWPTSNLTVHSDEDAKKQVQETNTSVTVKPSNVPPIDYAPLHIKGVHTTAPADAAARKARRLEEVRAKRVEAKSKKLVARKKMEQGVRDSLRNHAGKAERLARAQEKRSAVVPISA